MTQSLVFLSFDVDHDETERDLFLKQLAESGAPFAVQDSSAKDPFPSSDGSKLIQGKVGRCDLMVVLVGKHAASSPGLTKEIQFARHSNVPFFGVYVGGTEADAELPEGLPRNRTIPWAWDRVTAAATQLLAEGKNHTFV